MCRPCVSLVRPLCPPLCLPCVFRVSTSYALLISRCSYWQLLIHIGSVVCCSWSSGASSLLAVLVPSGALCLVFRFSIVGPDTCSCIPKLLSVSRFLVASCCFLWFLVASGDFWWFLVVSGGFWLLLVVSGLWWLCGFWWFLVLFLWFLVVSGCFWLCLVFGSVL